MSLTCNSHSGHFISIIITFPIDLLLVIIYHKCRNVNSYTKLFNQRKEKSCMISDNQSICPKCGGQLKYYDHVRRLVRTKFGNKKWVAIRRLRCCNCHAVHRELPDFIFPYKQYEADIIIGVLEGLITCETLGFEDYPCEMTMIRWHLFPPRLFLLTAVPNLK